MNIIYKDGKIVLIDDNTEIGELCYKKDSYGIVLIGTYMNYNYTKDVVVSFKIT